MSVVFTVCIEGLSGLLDGMVHQVTMVLNVHRTGGGGGGVWRYRKVNMVLNVHRSHKAS